MNLEQAQRKTAAQSKYGEAQLAEQQAREAHDQEGIDAAKVEQQQALDELFAVDEEIRTFANEERVVLISPNPRANIVDSNGLEFRDGRAEGVRKSVAERYVFDLDGYTIEEEK
jgi:hypothetical protein